MKRSNLFSPSLPGSLSLATMLANVAKAFCDLS
ncbi:hypothetical protein A2U01_0096031, partial [Trifolium medium]|nr:hypothetical protein [Trifolium medium]